MGDRSVTLLKGDCVDVFSSDRIHKSYITICHGKNGLYLNHSGKKINLENAYHRIDNYNKKKGNDRK